MTPEVQPGMFYCFRCGKLEPLSVDGSAEAELAKSFPGVEDEDCEKCCGECYAVLMAELTN